MKLRRLILIFGFLLLALLLQKYLEEKPMPKTETPSELEGAPVLVATPVATATARPAGTPEIKPDLSTAQKLIRQNIAKRVVVYKDLEHAFISNNVCDFAEYQEQLPIEMTVKVLMSRGSLGVDDYLLNEAFNVATSNPKSEGGKFFKAVYLAGLDDAHPNPKENLGAAEKMLRELNSGSPSNMAYILFLYEVLKLKGEQTPDLVDQLIGRGAFDTHVYELRSTLQAKAGTAVGLHAAALIQKELPRPNLKRIADLVESEVRFAAKDEGQALFAQTERLLDSASRRKQLALIEFPVEDELIPGKLNEAARNYLLMDLRSMPASLDQPPSLIRAVEALRREKDETGFEIKRCEPRLTRERYDWMKKHR